MFGPESGRETWRGLPFVYDKVRIGDQERVESFLGIFAKEGCRMVEMTCAEHDKYAAGSQFITHTMGRVLEKMALGTTPINTRGYETLLDLVENTSSDSFDLYYGLFMYNENAMEVLQSLGEAFEELKMELFRHLHKHNRNQLFGTQGKFKVKINGGALPSQNGNSLALPSQRSNDTGEPKVDPPLQNGNSGESPAQPSNDTMKAKVDSPSSQTCD
ncbi:hypothetical protein Leryth_021016 [Lithospermum erythrorhizon]|nr:hypothetical protein Leryth_021016 [Lithospermum erythrorhizon]